VFGEAIPHRRAGELTRRRGIPLVATAGGRHAGAVTDWDDPAAWYEVLNPWGPSDQFYLDLVMSAASVLDVGCGTGRLLRQARDAGHTGRLCGLDPDPAMLDQAGTRTDVEWVLADAASAAWDREFALATMASHAFQMLVDDEALRLRHRAAVRRLGPRTGHRHQRGDHHHRPPGLSELAAPRGDQA
jgi:SAM-dependent methyltransferase